MLEDYEAQPSTGTSSSGGAVTSTVHPTCAACPAPSATSNPPRIANHPRFLIPALALFQSTRFTAIVAALAYAAPAAIKIAADGIRGVSPTTVEAIM